MRSDGNSFGRVSLHVGADWRTHLSVYPDHTPILDIDAGSTSVSFSIKARHADQAAVEFAKELASQAAQFAAEVERFHALHRDSAPADDGSGHGEAA